MPKRVQNRPQLQGNDLIKMAGHRIPRKIVDEFRTHIRSRKQGMADALAAAMRTWVRLPRGYQSAALEELDCDEFFEALGDAWRKVGPE